SRTFVERVQKRQRERQRERQRTGRTGQVLRVHRDRPRATGHAITPDCDDRVFPCQVISCFFLDRRKLLKMLDFRPTCRAARPQRARNSTAKRARKTGRSGGRRRSTLANSAAAVARSPVLSKQLTHSTRASTLAGSRRSQASQCGRASSQAFWSASIR